MTAARKRPETIALAAGIAGYEYLGSDDRSPLVIPVLDDQWATALVRAEHIGHRGAVGERPAR